MTETLKLTVFSFLLPGQRFVFKRSGFAQRFVKIDYNLYTTVGAFETFSGKKVNPEGVKALADAEKLRTVDRDMEILMIA